MYMCGLQPRPHPLPSPCAASAPSFSTDAAAADIGTFFQRMRTETFGGKWEVGKLVVVVAVTAAELTTEICWEVATS